MDHAVYSPDRADIIDRNNVLSRTGLRTPAGSRSSFDLNLLTIFDALMQERNVTRAARRLGLSQPTASHALARLRQMLNDELFVRTPEGMQPTLRALQMAESVRDALHTLQSTFKPEAFDPSNSSDHFRILVNSYGARVIVPPLMQNATKAAPNVSLEVRPAGTIDVFDQLDADCADVALCKLADGGERFKCVRVIDDDYVVVLDREHAAAEVNAISLEHLAEIPHVGIACSDDATDFVDEVLRRHGMARKIAIQVPFLSIVLMLVGSDRLAVVPRSMASSLLPTCPLVAKELPFASPHIELSMIWHRRLDNHPAQRWLRGIIRASAARSRHLQP